MKRNFKKPLAAILSFLLLIGCFTGLPAVANATDGGTTPATVEESNLFTYTDFEDGTEEQLPSSPFIWNGSRNANNVGQYFTYKGQTSLFMNDVWNEDLKNWVPENMLTGKTMTADTSGLSYVVGNEGYRPVKVSFRFKPISKKQGNTNFYIYPLTFKTRKASVPYNQIVGMTVFLKTDVNINKVWQLNWAGATTGLYKPGAVAADAVDVFESITDREVTSTPINWSNADYMMDLTTNHDKAANAQLIGEAQWYDVEINYGWNDAENQVTLKALLKNDSEQRECFYTVTYNPEYIQDTYNFGFIVSGETNPIFIDNFALFSENLTTHEVVGPHTDFMNAHQTVIALADGFDVIKDYAEKTAEEKVAIKSTIDAFLTDYAALADFIKSYPEVATANENVIAMQKAILSYGEPASIKFISVQPQITDSIALIYKVSVGDLPEGSVPVMTFTVNDVTSKPVVGTQVGTTDMYTFKYSNIMAQNMADTITAVVTVDGKTESYDYSVMDYCKAILAKDSMDEYTPDKLAALKTLIVDLVRYGAAVQIYRNPGIAEADLLTGMLTDDELALGTKNGSLEGLEGVVSSKLTQDDTSAVTDYYKWKNANLVLKEKANLRFGFMADDISNLTIKVSVGGQEVASVENADFVATEIENQYYLDFDDIYAYEYDKEVQVTFWVGDVQQGKTLNYSVNTYMDTKKNSSQSGLVDLMNAINNFGNAAKKMQ